MVRDIINRQLIAHFRAHTSPLLALQFDPSGTMLVTASLHGHNIHVFHICPRQCASDKPASQRPTASAVHLFRLSRGVTPAVIEDISFSQSGAWLAVSSARGTTHLFRQVPCASFFHTQSLSHLLCFRSYLSQQESLLVYVRSVIKRCFGSVLVAVLQHTCAAGMKLGRCSCKCVELHWVYRFAVVMSV